MKSGIRNLLLASCFLFAVSYDSCTMGVDYDRRYKLNPEFDAYSCTFSKIYGQRWRKLGLVILYLGTALLIAAVIARHREDEQSGNKNLSILNLKE